MNCGRTTADKNHTGRGNSFHSNERAARWQEFAGPRGSVGQQLVIVASSVKRAQLAFTKWPRRFCCQQDSLLSLQKGFSLPKLTVLRRSAETPRETRYCFTAVARRSPRARLYSVEPRSSQWPSMVALIDGWPFKKSAVWARAARASGRMSALSKSK